MFNASRFCNSHSPFGLQGCRQFPITMQNWEKSREWVTVKMKNTLLVGFCMASLAAQAAPTYSITDIGNPFDGANVSNVAGINSSGQVVGSFWSSAGSRAFIWSQSSGFTSVEVAGQSYSYGNGINDKGQIVGELGFRNSSTGFVWDAGQTTLIPESAWANGINNAGQVVVRSSSTPTQQFARWDPVNGTIAPFPTPAAYTYNTSGWAIGNSGVVAGRQDSASFNNATIWSAANTPTNLGTLGGPTAEARAINDSGIVVGESHTANWYQTQTTHAFIWDATNGMRDLGSLGNGSSFAKDVSNNGTVVGVSMSMTGNAFMPTPEAFLWTEQGGMQDLASLANLGGTGWQSLQTANGINESGQIVGMGIRDGQTHAFLLTPTAPIPEPETYAMMLAGLGLLGVAARRRKQKSAA